LSELADKYTLNYRHQANFLNAKKRYLRNFKEYFGKDSLLTDIRYVDLELYRTHLKGKLTRFKTIRSDATINREMSCLHHIFSKAMEWEMIEQSPFDRGKSLIIKENNQRLRFLNEDEIDRFLDACPLFLRHIVECAIMTGMRRSEILGLKWDQVRNGFIYLDKTKNNKARQIPISDELARVFKEIRKEQHLTSQYVFTYKGQPMKSNKSAFRMALKRAGIVDFRFHDLRHTFASQILIHGGSLKDVQELLGHKDMTMTLRYSHLTQERKKKAVNLLNRLTAKPDGHKMVKISTGVNKDHQLSN
jgi:integrase